jgi:hypothetical protein
MKITVRHGSNSNGTGLHIASFKGREASVQYNHADPNKSLTDAAAKLARKLGVSDYAIEVK